MGRRASVQDSLSRPASRVTGKFVRGLQTAVNVLIGFCITAAFVWSLWAVEQSMVENPRFFLPGPPEPGVASENFQVHGAVHAQEKQIVNVFSRDFGRSIYLCPIQERRRRLLAIDWVRDANVSRVWPNTLIVRISERTPVAFAQMPSSSGMMMYWLIDAEGVLLHPQRAGKLGLPVLAGIPGSEPEVKRKVRVARFLRLQHELGTNTMDKISEIDVSDPENLQVTQQFGSQALTLMLGNQNFLQRYRGFTDHREEILKRLPDAIVLDLRLKDRITAVSRRPAAGTEAGRR
jgi:cell division protein FtsQ